MHLLITAAGRGSRMGASCNKLLLPLAGRPLLSWTLDAAQAAQSIRWVGLIGQPRDQEAIFASCLPQQRGHICWIQGGKTRQQSVRCGLAALPTDASHVLIHDGARCLVEPSLFDRCAAIVLGGEAVIAATPVTDTIKQVNKNGVVIATPDRSSLWAAQTPQGFSVDQLRKGHAEAERNGWAVTDDASIYEQLGSPVRVLNAGSYNIKVTAPFDLTIAEATLNARLST